MKNSFFIAAIALAACSNSTHAPTDTIDHESTPWIVSGKLLLADGTPVANHEIEFQRNQRNRNGEREGFTFARIKTNSSGEFYLSSELKGNYLIVSKFEFPCIVGTKVMDLDANSRKNIRLVFDKKKDCDISL